jgi:tetratricopeptide (TPR) repeat protein
LLLHDGKAEEALAVLKRELALPDAGAETPYYAGLAAVQLGRYAEAAPLLESAARWLPQNLDAPLALAQVYLALKEPGKAVTAARQAVAVAPASSAAHELLLAALTQTGQTQELEKEQQRWQKLPAK